MVGSLPALKNATISGRLRRQLQRRVGPRIDHSVRILATASLLLAISVHWYYTLNPTFIARLTARMPKRKRDVQVVG